ncbi:hypothetical protein ACFT7S_06920 [Streptomyces sp. NPDC057136]|uniref:hypothetical protein n=1 Tax=Streptomyces sp. NPDC057136 TaxID=3346029 RepID=UPI0036404CDF
MPPAEPHTTPFPVPAEFVRYAVALEPAEVGWGYVTGRLSAEDAVRLAFLRRCDLRERAGEFARFEALEPSAPELGVVCRELAESQDDARRIWDYLALNWSCSRADGEEADVLDALAAGRDEFLLGRAASGEGMNWQNSSALLGTDRPEEIDAAFDRGEDLVGVAVIGLALNHPDAHAILPRVARALESADAEQRRQGRVALAHVARLHRTVDRRCLELLRSQPRGNEADDDLWSYVAHRRLPIWLWRHHLAERLTWLLRDRWRD